MTQPLPGQYRVDTISGNTDTLEKDLEASRQMGATVVSVCCLGRDQQDGHFMWAIILFIPD